MPFNWWNGAQLSTIISLCRDIQMRQMRMEDELKAMSTQNAALEELNQRLKVSANALNTVIQNTKVEDK